MVKLEIITYILYLETPAESLSQQLLYRFEIWSQQLEKQVVILPPSLVNPSHIQEQQSPIFSKKQPQHSPMGLNNFPRVTKENPTKEKMKNIKMPIICNTVVMIPEAFEEVAVKINMTKIRYNII